MIKSVSYLEWGLVAFFRGLGFTVTRNFYGDNLEHPNSEWIGTYIAGEETEYPMYLKVFQFTTTEGYTDVVVWGAEGPFSHEVPLLVSSKRDWERFEGAGFKVGTMCLDQTRVLGSYRDLQALGEWKKDPLDLANCEGYKGA